MSAIATTLTLDEQKSILKSCATSAVSFGEINEENHILHKIKTTSFSTSVNSATFNVPASKAAATIEGVSSTNVFSQTPQPILSHTSSSSATLTETSFTEQHRRLLEAEIHNLKIEESRLHQQCNEAQRREKILMRRLANKEQEFQDYVSQIAEYKSTQAPGPSALRSALLDPAVNLLFDKIKKELQATKAKLEDTQQELAAWKFTPDSNTGKRLMAKCRLLHQENEELGKMTSNGRLAKLETELAMQKSFAEEVKKSQSELDDLLQELDEDVEGMQSTILFLQQELKVTRERIQFLEKENCQLKNGITDDAQDTLTATTQQHILNGSAVNTSIGEFCYNVNNNPGNKCIPGTNFSVHSGTQLETIDENSCLRTSNNNNSIQQLSGRNNSDFINGITNKDNAPTQIIKPVNSDDVIVNNTSNINSSVTLSNKNNLPPRKRNYESDSSECGSANGATTRNSYIKKGKINKSRRASSVLSVDATEDDSRVGDTPANQSDADNNNSQPTRIMTRRKSTRNYQEKNL